MVPPLPAHPSCPLTLTLHQILLLFGKDVLDDNHISDSSLMVCPLLQRPPSSPSDP